MYTLTSMPFMLSLDCSKVVSHHGPLPSALQYQTPRPFVCLTCRPPAHLPVFFPLLAHSIIPVSSLSHLEVTFFCLQLLGGDFLREIFFPGLLISFSHLTCSSPLHDKPAWLLTGPS